LALLPHNKPRFHSISSSPKVFDKAVSITVSIVGGTSPTGCKHEGLCSSYLARHPMKMPQSELLPHGHMPLLVFVKDTGSAFRLPASVDTPIIMVGPGTGLAPTLGFIQERVSGDAKKNVLFFGCRNDDDYLYREELEAWKASGHLELHVGFSRKEGMPKTYVQVIQKESARVAELLKEGAHIYICGDASHMAAAVRLVLEGIAEEAGLGGHNFMAEMEAQGRYCRDVWAAQSV